MNLAALDLHDLVLALRHGTVEEWRDLRVGPHDQDAVVRSKWDACDALAPLMSLLVGTPEQDAAVEALDTHRENVCETCGFGPALPCCVVTVKAAVPHPPTLAAMQAAAAAERERHKAWVESERAKVLARRAARTGGAQ